MERLTTNKSVDDMSMVELAHNSCYVDDECNARYRDYDMEMDARDFARNLMVTLAEDELAIRSNVIYKKHLPETGALHSSRDSNPGPIA